MRLNRLPAMSLISEAVFNHLAPAGWRASTEGYFSKSWDNLPVTPDVVATVCAGAAGETCPAYLGPVLCRVEERPA